MSNGPLKDSAGKPLLSLIPPLTLMEVGQCFTFGGIKYQHNFNHLKSPGLSYNQMLSAALRHIFKFLAGERHDKESGYHHLAHAIADLMMICEYEFMGNLGVDDRGYANAKRNTVSEVIQGSEGISISKSGDSISEPVRPEPDFRPDLW